MFSETVFINPKIRKIVSAIVVYSSLAAAIVFLGFLLIFFENPQWDRFQLARVISLEYQRDSCFCLTERSIAGNFSRKILERLLEWKSFIVGKYEYDLHWWDYWERSAASESVGTRWTGGAGPSAAALFVRHLHCWSLLDAVERQGTAKHTFQLTAFFTDGI